MDFCDGDRTLRKVSCREAGTTPRVGRDLAIDQQGWTTRVSSRFHISTTNMPPLHTLAVETGSSFLHCQHAAHNHIFETDRATPRSSSGDRSLAVQRTKSSKSRLYCACDFLRASVRKSAAVWNTVSRVKTTSLRLGLYSKADLEAT